MDFDYDLRSPEGGVLGSAGERTKFWGLALDKDESSDHCLETGQGAHSASSETNVLPWFCERNAKGFASCCCLRQERVVRKISPEVGVELGGVDPAEVVVAALRFFDDGRRGCRRWKLYSAHDRQCLDGERLVENPLQRVSCLFGEGIVPVARRVYISKRGDEDGQLLNDFAAWESLRSRRIVIAQLRLLLLQELKCKDGGCGKAVQHNLYIKN